MSEVIEEQLSSIPVLPLRDVVVYPHMVIPLFVGREKSIKALEAAMENDKQILLVSQKSAAQDEPETDDLYNIGTISSILQLLKLPDGTVKVLVEGNERARIVHYMGSDDYFTAQMVKFEDEVIDEREAEVLSRSLTTQFDQYVKLNKKIPPEILTSLSSIEDPNRLVDTIAAHMSLKIDEKQKILEIVDLRERLEHLMTLMESELDLLQVEKRIRGRVKRQMEKSQREYYLNEQMKAIQKELGDMEDVPSEMDELEEKIEKAGMSKEAKAKAKQLADLADVTLGKPTYISESIQAPPPIYPRVMYEGAAAPAPTAPPISPGEMEISLTIQVVYAILG